MTKTACARILFLLLLSPLAAFAQDFASYDSQPPGKLLDDSIKSTSIVERVAIRAYLAGKYPTTAAGLVSKAWLASYDDKTDEALKIYRDCLTQYPDFPLALNNLISELGGKKDSEKERIALYERLLNHDPSFRDYLAVRFVYFIYANELKDQKAADEFLTRWEQKFPGNYIFDYVRALYAQSNEKDYQKAEKFYLAAIAKGTSNFSVYRDLTNLRLSELSSANSDPNKRADYLTLITDYYKEHRDSAEALIYLGDKASDVFKSARYGFDFYRRAFEIKHTAEPVLAALDLSRTYDGAIFFDEGTVLLQRANRLLPNNYKILTALAKITEDEAQAERYFQQAIKYSYTFKDEWASANELASNIYEDRQFDHDRAEKLLLSYLDKSGNKSGLSRLYLNRVEGKDYRKALTYLNDYEKYLKTGENAPNSAWFIDRRTELENFLRTDEQAKVFDEENPYLKYWRSTFGESLVLNINFAPGSDKIPAGEAEKLLAAANALKDKRADQYVFSVEGHTDRYAGEIAKALSQRRAEAVAKTLREKYGVAPERLRAVGYGDNAPLVAETSAANRLQNNRIEIFPFASFEKPTISATAALNADSTLAVSPDGRLFVTGNSPMQVWDAQQGIKIKDLGKSGDTHPDTGHVASGIAFSPNGRYLAAFNKDIQYTLDIYDINSGLLLDRIPSVNNIVAFDWDPFSQRIAYSTGDSRLITYDLKRKRQVKALYLDAPQNIKTLVWTRQNKIVTGQGQTQYAKVFNADTLALEQTLEGPNWPHAIGRTFDSKYVVSGDDRRTLSVWDTSRNWSLRQMSIPVLAKGIYAHPSKPWLIIHDWGGSKQADEKIFYKVIVVDVENMSIVAEKDAGETSSAGYRFTADGTKIYHAASDSVEILDLPALKMVSEITGTAVRPFAGASDRKNGYYISADKLAVSVWDVRTGKNVKTWNGAASKFSRLGDAPDQFVAINNDKAARKATVSIINTSQLEKREILTLDFTVDAWASNAQVIALAGTGFQPTNVGSKDGFVAIYDLHTLAVKSKIEVPLVTDYLRYSLFRSEFLSLDINRAGTEVVILSSWQDGFGMSTTYSQEIRTFDLSSGKQIHAIKFDDTARVVSYNKEKSELIDVGTGRGTYTYKPSGEFVSWSNKRSYETDLNLENSRGLIRWSPNYLRYTGLAEFQKRQLLFAGSLVDLAAFEKENVLVALTKGNEISFYDLSSLKKRQDIVSKKNNEWVAYTPDGNFIASANGAQRVVWVVGGKYLPIGQKPPTMKPPTE
jgi:outer membrane protein OmpA-like peptidoglycan-associated protein/DNA-binding beta-propeller fold protein YncE